MKLTRRLPDAARVRRRAASIAALVAMLSLLLPLGGAHAAEHPVPLDAAESFAILAGSTITNTGSTTVTGDIGLHPGTETPGYDLIDHEGARHVANDEAAQAKDDLTTAYNDAANRTTTETIGTELGGETLTAGVYDSASGTFEVSAGQTLTLDGENNPDAVFIFQMESSLVTGAVSSVELIRGADLCNVFWQVGSDATLGTNSVMVGTVMADQSIWLNTGATVEGRVLARIAEVTMDTNTITNAACGPFDTDNGDNDNGENDNGENDNGDNGDNGENDNGENDNGEIDNGTPVEDATTDQVEEVPSGPVAAGGGGVDTAPGGMSQLFAGVLILVAVGGTVGIAARRRVRV